MIGCQMTDLFEYSKDDMIDGIEIGAPTLSAPASPTSTCSSEQGRFFSDRKTPWQTKYSTQKD
jgi:hypothetical protein